MDLSLDHLDASGDPDHIPIVILLTDGQGSYSHSLTQRAADAGVTIFTIGLGTSVDGTLLRAIADGTGGQYFNVANASDLPDVFRRLGDGEGGAGTDTDGDGLPDQMELDGIRLGTGRLITTDPNNADTDGDGLTDAEELERVPTSPWGGPYRNAASDPRSADRDNDGLSDVDERSLGTNPWRADSDGDGLSDGFEIDNDFDPTHANPDGDHLDDSEEHAADSDPYEFNRQGWDRARAVMAGAVYGDTGPSVCSWILVPLVCSTTETLEYLGGSILSGFVAVGDIRDALGAIARLDLGDALIAAVGVVPLFGDAVKVADAVRAFLRSADKAAPVARWIVKEFDNSTVVRKSLEAAGAGDEVTSLSTDVLRSLARSGNDMEKLTDAMRQGLRLVDDIPLSSTQRTAISSRVANQWPNAVQGTYRSQAYGVETAVEILKRRGYDILYVGRPNAIELADGSRKTLTSGPDIVAVRNGRTVVVEAKASINTVSLSSRRVSSQVGGQRLYENSREWLETNPDRYLNALRDSQVPEHTEAYNRLRTVARSDGSYDAVFIGAGGSGQRFGRIDDAAIEITGDAGSVEYLTAMNRDL